MIFRSKRLCINKAKEIDIVHYLSQLGYEPSKIRNNDYWYRSPLRNEKTASFKVNRKLNRWYDHGLGKGGNLIDFAILYHNCTIGELFEKLSTSLSFQQPIYKLPVATTEQDNRLKVLREFSLSSYALLRYLEHRRIPVAIADFYCREVRYELNCKVYYGIGFKNDLGGFEIRNPYFKGSSALKGITTFDNSADEAIIFEGFMDFLSFMAIHQNNPKGRFDFAVLNSLSFFETARPFMEKHKVIRLYLDRDTAGQNCSSYALSLSTKYIDESNLYKNHKDFNEWLMHFGKPYINNQNKNIIE